MAKNKVKKEPLKVRDPQKYYRNVHYGLYAGTWISTLTPIIAIFGVKWNEYFDYISNTEGSVKLTIGCVIAIVLAIVFSIKKAKVEEKQNKQYTMIHYVGFVAILWAFLFFFKVIIDDMFLITSAEFVGAVSAYGFSIADNKAKEKIILYKNAQEEVIKESAKENYKKRKENLL